MPSPMGTSSGCNLPPRWCTDLNCSFWMSPWPDWTQRGSTPSATWPAAVRAGGWRGWRGTGTRRGPAAFPGSLCRRSMGAKRDSYSTSRWTTSREYCIVATSLEELDDNEYHGVARSTCDEFVRGEISEEHWHRFRQRISYVPESHGAAGLAEAVGRSQPLSWSQAASSWNGRCSWASSVGQRCLSRAAREKRRRSTGRWHSLSDCRRTRRPLVTRLRSRSVARRAVDEPVSGAGRASHHARP